MNSTGTIASALPLAEASASASHSPASAWRLDMYGPIHTAMCSFMASADAKACA